MAALRYDKQFSIVFRSFMNFDIQTLIVAAIGAVAGMFAKPIAEKLVDRFFSRKPVFAASPHVIRHGWSIQIAPVNSPARRKRPLNLSFRGAIILNAGRLSRKNNTLQWNINFGEIEAIRDELIQNSFADFQLFFDSNHMSETIRVAYKPTQAADSELRSSVFVETPKSLVQSISSQRTIFIRESELRINDAFPTTTRFVSWTSVFDGKEICISDLEEIEILGEESALLTDPRYAWVLKFNNCHGLTIRNLTIGHTTAGYCLGGVLKFENCSRIKIDSCDLYGSGTYGFEFINCTDVDVDRTTVRDCSYGILKMTNCRNITFTDCHFANNREFDLCEFSGFIEDVMFRKSLFEKNFTNRSFFSFREITEESSHIFVWDCSFRNNTFSRLHDKSDVLSESDNRYLNNNQTYIEGQ